MWRLSGFVLLGLCCLYSLTSAAPPVAKKTPPVVKDTPPVDKEAAEKANEANQRNGDPFTFDDIFNSSLKPRSFSVRWNNGEDGYTFRENGHLYYYDIPNDITTFLLDNAIFQEHGATRYSVSQDRRYILLTYDVRTVWRHSYFAKYKVYDRIGSGSPIVYEFPNDDTLRSQDLMLAKWAPEGTGLAFVHDNDLYYQDSPEDVSVRVTSNADPLYKFNGVPDWVYEEEILGSHDATWFSHDGSRLVYAFFDDTNVPLFKIPMYGEKTDVYGNIVEIAYPKAGDLTPGHNSIASLYTLRVHDPDNQVILQVPEELANVDHYFHQVTWESPVMVAVVWASRVQNYTITTLCNTNTGVCLKNLELSQAGGWLDPTPYMRFIEGGTHYLTILPHDVPDEGSWNHLAYVTADVGVEATVVYLSNGAFEVKSVVGFEADRNLVYYVSTMGDTRARHLYRVGTPIADPEYLLPVCLTCAMAPDCNYVSASMSSTGRYYLVGCLGPEIPKYILIGSATPLTAVKEDNADIAANLALKSLPRKEYIQIPVGGGYVAWAEVFIPPSEGPGVKFPFITHVYGGPGSQAVDFRFDTAGLHSHLTSMGNVAYVRVDGRGTSSNGNDNRFQVYRRLGTVEIEDQILAASWLKTNVEYIDAEARTGIWGWSYGGYATQLALANEANEFDCGIAGALMASYRHYDTAYTERVMGMATLDDNSGGYDLGDITNKIELLRDKTLLIVHGTSDDNVHFAASIPLIKGLIDAEIQFRLQIYPDRNHYFGSSNRHLQRLYVDFWVNDCFGVARKAKPKQVKVLF